MHPFVQVRQAEVDAARAQEAVLARTDLPRVYRAVEPVPRGSGAKRERRARRRRRRPRPRSARTGRPASRWCFRTSSTSRVCARARRRRGVRRAREAALLRRSVLTVVSEQQIAAAMLQAARAIAANTPMQLAAAQQSESAGPCALRGGARQPSSRSPTRRVCSRRPRCRTSSRASTCGARCSPRRRRKASLATFLSCSVPDRRSSLACGSIRVALRGPITIVVAVIAVALDRGVRRQPDARGHLSRSGSAGDLRGAAVRRHEPGADGRISSSTTTSTTSSTSTASRASNRSRFRTRRS